ncbi:MAG: HD domain-containing phosphohydrolase [Longimicrobiales bacterium]
MKISTEGLSPGVRSFLEEAVGAEKEGRPREAREAYERALRSLEPNGGGNVAPQLFRAIGRAHFDEGQTDAAVDCFIVALETAQAHDDLSEVANAFNSIAVTAFNRGDLEEAVVRFSAAQEIAREIGNVELVAMIEQNLGAVAALRGECEQALDHYNRSLEAFREHGLDGRIGPLLCNIGRLEIEVDKADDAARTLTEAIRFCTATGDIRHEILARVNQTMMEIAAGDWDAAERSSLQVRERAHAAGDPRWEGLILKQLGIVAVNQERPEEALQLLTESRGIAEAREDVVLQGEVAAEMARIYRAQDRNRETLDALFQAHAVFKRVQADKALADIDLRLAEFESVFLAIVQEWGESIDAKDPYTQGHCTRVAEYAVALAESDGLDPKVLMWFRMGALLHDVGKVIIPDEILNKPGKLDAEEFAIVQQHPAAGESLLAGVEFPWDVLPMVRHHHERWDGRGYPDGIAGEAIPRAARILAVADVFDAVTTNRPYRSAMELQVAMNIMEEESGGAFDPELYALFIELLDAGVIASHLTAQITV